MKPIYLLLSYSNEENPTILFSSTSKKEVVKLYNEYCLYDKVNQEYEIKRYRHIKSLNLDKPRLAYIQSLTNEGIPLLSIISTPTYKELRQEEEELIVRHSIEWGKKNPFKMKGRFHTSLITLNKTKI